MKKQNVILIMALIAMITEGLRAQTSFILSPEIGIQSSKMKATGDLDFNGSFPTADVNYAGIFSYNGGVNFGVQFADTWGIMTGVKFNRKGGKVTVETRDPNNPFAFLNPDGTIGTDVGEITIENTHNWLSIPVLATAQFGNTLKVGLAIGPQFNLGLGEYKETVEFNLENTNLPAQEENGEFGTSTNSVYKKSHMSLVVLPYLAYEISDQGSVKLSVMIESGSDMVNENYVVGDGAGGTRNVSGTLKNNQFGVTLSYVHTFDIEAGVKY